MQKCKQARPHVLTRKITSILCLLVLGLAIPMAVLYKENAQGTRAATSAGVTVDFGSRQNKAHPIPSTFIGSGGVGLKLVTKNIGSAVSQANFRFTKLGDYDYLGQIFPTASSVTQPTQQSWTHIDEELQIALSYHLQPMIELAYTPVWLQPQNQKPPQPNYCLGYNPPLVSHSSAPMYLVNGKDQGAQMWGRLAALVVAHVDQKFPQSHALYEIWNQPDGSQFLCAPKTVTNAAQYRYNAYRAMYAATAPQMKQQAQKDGVQIQIGGPGLVYALQNHLSWLTNLLSDPAIYPYVDFISYHRYMAAPSFNSGSNSFVAQAQGTLFGIASQYEQVAQIVRAGKQPNAANTPIYMDEYSMNTCAPNHCVNDPVTSPLMNALFVMDFLNAVNDTKSPYGAPKAVPATLALYSWDIPQHYLCMFGAYDSNWDCGGQFGTTILPYPEYYVYDLLGGSNYLNISDSGYVANSASANLGGVFATGFYTRSRDSIVIVNTTGNDYAALNVLAQNAGTVSGTQANVYTLSFNRSNPSQSISTKQVNLVKGSNGYTASVHLPANTVIAISFAA